MKKDLDFLFELGTMRNVPRAWRQHLGLDCASVLEHTIRVMWLALILARKEGIQDEEKVIKMALVHDVGESRTADHNYLQKVYVEEHEDEAVKDSLSHTLLEDFYSKIFKEYEARKTPEAKVVKDADNLDVDIELKELENMGSKLAVRWSKFRRQVRDEKLYTKSAKDLWDLIQAANPDSWHQEINKWLRHPNAGR